MCASWLLTVLVTSAGCAHQAQTESIPNELRRVGADELFEEAVWHAARGDSLRAEQYLGAARDRGYSPQKVVAWLVMVCVASDRYRAALDHASRHLRSYPSNWWLRLVVANIYDALGDSEAAKSELEQVILAEPLRSLPHYRLGLLYTERFGDPVRAAHHLNTYRELDPYGVHVAEAEKLISEITRGEAEPSSQSALQTEAR